MQLGNAGSPKRVRGWLFDVYPSDFGEIAVWIISENGERAKLTDKFQQKIYISGKQEDIEQLASSFFSNQVIASWNFVYKYAQSIDSEKSRVLEVALKDCRKTSAFTRSILEKGDYLRYQVHNCDLHGDRAYLFNRDLFPLAHVEVETKEKNLEYKLLDSVKHMHYSVPPLRITRLEVEIAKKNQNS